MMQNQLKLVPLEVRVIPLDTDNSHEQCVQYLYQFLANKESVLPNSVYS